MKVSTFQEKYACAVYWACGLEETDLPVPVHVKPTDPKWEREVSGMLSVAYAAEFRGESAE